MLKIKVVEKINTHIFMFCNLFSENRAVYEKMSNKTCNARTA